MSLQERLESWGFFGMWLFVVLQFAAMALVFGALAGFVWLCYAIGGEWAALAGGLLLVSLVLAAFFHAATNDHSRF